MSAKGPPDAQLTAQPGAVVQFPRFSYLLPRTNTGAGDFQIIRRSGQVVSLLPPLFSQKLQVFNQDPESRVKGSLRGP